VDYIGYGMSGCQLDVIIIGYGNQKIIPFKRVQNFINGVTNFWGRFVGLSLVEGR